jgi:hypothetical protein
VGVNLENDRLVKTLKQYVQIKALKTAGGLEFAGEGDTYPLITL